jgi:hypothetical protein
MSLTTSSSLLLRRGHSMLFRSRPSPAAAVSVPCAVVVPSRQSHNRPNTRHPQRPSWFRQQLIEVSTPLHTPKHPTTEILWQDCPKHNEELEEEAKKQPNDYEMIYVRELGRNSPNSYEIFIRISLPMSTTCLFSTLQDIPDCMSN